MSIEVVETYVNICLVQVEIQLIDSRKRLDKMVNKKSF